MNLTTVYSTKYESAYEFLISFEILDEHEETLPLISMCEKVWKNKIDEYKEGFGEEDYYLNDFILEVVEGESVEYLEAMCKYITDTQEEFRGCMYDVTYDGFITIRFLSIEFEDMDELHKFYYMKKKEMSS
jgi:hypothetical protein